MISRNRSRIVHIYSKNDEEREYDGFLIFPEREDREEDGTPGETVADSSEPSDSLPTTTQTYQERDLAAQMHATSAPADSVWDRQYYVCVYPKPCLRLEWE